MLAAARAALHANPREVSADAGYCTEANLLHLERHKIAGYVATGRARQAQAGPGPLTHTGRIAAMALKTRRARFRSRYRMRKMVVELVFGQIKSARTFRQFLLRGLNAVQGEWAMIATAHNLLNSTGQAHDFSAPSSPRAHNPPQRSPNPHYTDTLLGGPRSFLPMRPEGIGSCGPYSAWTRIGQTCCKAD